MNTDNPNNVFLNENPDWLDDDDNLYIPALVPLQRSITQGTAKVVVSEWIARKSGRHVIMQGPGRITPYLRASWAGTTLPEGDAEELFWLFIVASDGVQTTLHVSLSTLVATLADRGITSENDIFLFPENEWSADFAPTESDKEYEAYIQEYLHGPSDQENSQTNKNEIKND